uniref:Retrotransposon gag domain-containing protein n=1 Tax=Ficus carica TaxID=3494 RepID=A0AA88D181_FICCA|nr:hypothetical protein TIFTF001_043746 [Ficus carica]GMN24069.1 hypothetical protein TIFTF001_043751 [Ficus carica]
MPVNQNPPAPDLATVVANLQRQLLEQQQETNRLREQLAQINQRPQANEVPPQNVRVPPVVPPVPDIRPEVQPEVPIAPVEAHANLPPEKVLCASFALKKDARHWWMTVQMRRDVTTMSWQDFVSEFRTMYFNREILAAQQDEFTSLRQGTMTVMEAINKFEQLARLCPELVPGETEKVRLMMKMFRSDIAKQVSAGDSPPTRVSDCISRAIRAEYWINRDKEERAQFFKAKKEEKAMGKQTQPRQNFEMNQKGSAKKLPTEKDFSGK